MGRFSDAIGDCKAAIVNDPEVRKLFLIHLVCSVILHRLDNENQYNQNPGQ